ncbi:unnamed protein product [Amoebophrya sp. A25]|nr:unnamed protein product [Amoebophrya sp. A25]|eukprot:GSA25T00024471001.1
MASDDTTKSVANGRFAKWNRRGNGAAEEEKEPLVKSGDQIIDPFAGCGAATASDKKEDGLRGCRRLVPVFACLAVGVIGIGHFLFYGWSGLPNPRTSFGTDVKERQLAKEASSTFNEDASNSFQEMHAATTNDTNSSSVIPWRRSSFRGTRKRNLENEPACPYDRSAELEQCRTELNKSSTSLAQTTHQLKECEATLNATKLQGRMGLMNTTPRLGARHNQESGWNATARIDRGAPSVDELMDRLEEAGFDKFVQKAVAETVGLVGLSGLESVVSTLMNATLLASAALVNTTVIASEAGGPSSAAASSFQQMDALGVGPGQLVNQSPSAREAQAGGLLRGLRVDRGDVCVSVLDEKAKRTFVDGLLQLALSVRRVALLMTDYKRDRATPEDQLIHQYSQRHRAFEIMGDLFNESKWRRALDVAAREGGLALTIDRPDGPVRYDAKDLSPDGAKSPNLLEIQPICTSRLVSSRSLFCNVILAYMNDRRWEQDLSCVVADDQIPCFVRAWRCDGGDCVTKFKEALSTEVNSRDENPLKYRELSERLGKKWNAVKSRSGTALNDAEDEYYRSFCSDFLGVIRQSRYSIFKQDSGILKERQDKIFDAATALLCDSRSIAAAITNAMGKDENL